jgi:hypothetical protein
MAEAFPRMMAADRFDVVNAGNEQAPIDPDAVEVMREGGIDISRQPYSITDGLRGHVATPGSRRCRPKNFDCTMPKQSSRT